MRRGEGEGAVAVLPGGGVAAEALAVAGSGVAVPPVAAVPPRRNFAAPVGLKMAGLASAAGRARDTLPEVEEEEEEEGASSSCVTNEGERQRKCEEPVGFVEKVAAVCPPVP